MKARKHSPGPWSASRGDTADGMQGQSLLGPGGRAGEDGWLLDAAGRSVLEYKACGTHEAVWNNLYDKKLALAGPDMLAALDAVEGYFRQHPPRGEDGKSIRALVQAVREQAGGDISEDVLKLHQRLNNLWGKTDISKLR